METIPTKLDSKAQPKSTTRVTVHGDISKKMKIGEPAEMKLLGKVQSIKPNEKHADHFDVEIEEPEVTHIDNEGNYENLAKMPKEMLKKKITPKDDSAY
jgi:hypothetical protein